MPKLNHSCPALLRNGVLSIVCAVYLTACATAGGAVLGAGIGALAGDPEAGMAVGATAGAVVDVFGR